MKFAFLAKRFYTNKDLIGDGFGRLFHLPVQLSRLGHQGIVIAGDLHTKKMETVTNHGIVFHSVPLSLFSLFGFISSAGRVLRDFNPDVIIASGDSYLGYISLRLAESLDVPLFFDVYDDYTAFKTNRLPGMKSLFHRAVRKAETVIVSSEPLRRKLMPFNSDVVVVENGFDPELFHPLPKANARSGLGIPVTDVVAGYFGTISEDLGIHVLLEAAKLLRTEVPNLRLLLAGYNGSNVDLVGEGIDYRGFLPQEKIPALINACDVVVIPYLPSPQVQQSNACKLAEYIACEVPIVATKVSNHAEVLAAAPRGLCEPGSSGALAAAVRAQLDAPQRASGGDRLAWENLAGRLAEAISEKRGNLRP